MLLNILDTKYKYDEDVCLYAIKENINAFQFVENKTQQIYLQKGLFASFGGFLLVRLAYG